jgi:hypothetical protein
MKTKYFSLYAEALIILAVLSPVLATSVTLVPDSFNAVPGSTVNVSVDISVSSPGINIAAFTSYVLYDKNVFTYEEAPGIVQGDLLISNWELSGFRSGPNEFRALCVLWDAPYYDALAAGYGTLFSFTLKVNEDAPMGLSALTWGVYDEYDPTNAGFSYGDAYFGDIFLQNSEMTGNSINVIPEPTTIGLLIIGAITVLRKRK